MTITNAILTAYCACKICCGHNATGLAANGRPPVEGVTIAASRSIPLGSTVIWRGRRYSVQDRLARKYDQRFDVYFTNHQKAKQFGIHKNETLTIVTNN